jgi:CBS domain-containing protein
MARKVQDVMTRNVDVARPDQPVREIAQHMAQGGFGFMPVVHNGKLIGAITDRDLAVRVLAAGMDASTPVGEVLTREVSFVRPDEDLDDALAKLGDEQLHRLPVLNEMDELVGVVTLSDLTTFS